MGDYGVPSGSSAELHLKMSKKIAQLTKVIFHLNTRNEDFQMEFTHLKQVHSIELQQLTQDAANKLKLLTEQLQSQKEQAAQVDARATKEKQQFLKDLALFQQQAGTQLSTAQKEFQRRVAMLEEQVEQSRRAFVERIQQLTQLAENQQQKLHSQSMASSVATQRELEELKCKHSDEMEQVVMSSNARYTQMLAEQLRLQDTLKQELISEKTKWQQTASLEQQTLQTQLKKEREDAQSRLEETKRQFVGKMEHLLADLETLRGQEAKVRQEKEDLLKTAGEMQRQLKMQELQVTKAQQETLSVRKDSDANVLKMQHTLALATERIDQLTLEIETLKKTLVSRDVALQHVTTERDTLQLDLMQGSANLSEKFAQHTQQLSERDLKLANLQAELAMVLQQTATSEAQANKKIQSLETRIRDKEKEVCELQQKLASGELLRTSLQKDMDKTQAELTRKLDDAEKTIATRRAEHAKAIQELQTAHSFAMASLQSGHKQALELLNREGDQRVSEMETQLKQHSSASMEKALSDAKQQHVQVIAFLQKTMETREATSTHETTQLQLQIQQLQEELTRKNKETTETQTTIVELRGKLSKCEAQLTQLLKEKETLTTTSQKTLKERDESFQKQLKELTAQHESAVKRLSSEKDRLVVDHTQALLQMTQDHTTALHRVQQEWEKDQQQRLTSQNEELSELYDQQLTALRQEIHEQHTSAEQAALAASEAQQQLQEARACDTEGFHSELRRLLEKTDHNLVEMERQHQNRMETALLAHANEMQRLTIAHKKEKDDLLRASVDQMELKRTQLTTQHAQEMETMRVQHATATHSLQEALQIQRNSEALALRAEMAHKLKELRVQKDQDHARAMQESTEAHVTQYTALQQTAHATQTQLSQRSEELQTTQREYAVLQRLLDDRTLEFHDRVASLEKGNREEVEKLKLAAKRDMDRLLEENLHETQQLSDQFEETKKLMLDKVVFLKQTIADWELKYEQRESRAEDVMRIAVLERCVAEKDALVKKTLDEMAYFKRELLNREEMYNKTFARTPNVGVLQVLKPHVLLQSQMMNQTQILSQMPPTTTPTPTPPPQSTRRKSVKPSTLEPRAPESLQRRGSERGATTTTPTTRKALPPLMSNNNQALGL